MHRLHVVVDMGLLDEGLQANLALVRSLPSMCPHVFLQGAGADALQPAEATLQDLFGAAAALDLPPIRSSHYPNSILLAIHNHRSV